jgi:LiaI-LiaF-like transmembrane region/N-terminal domain of toast_rack, DUF2154
MKPGRVFWGVFFLLLGGLFLADRVGLFSLPHFSLWRFWPLILVLIGVSLLLRRSKLQWLPVALAGGGLALLVASVSTFSWVDGGFEGNHEVRSQTLVVPARPGLEKVTLRVETGAGSIELLDTTSEMFTASTETTFGEYRLEHDSTGAGEEIRLMLEGQKHRWNFGRMRNGVELRLNSEPVWDLEFSLGASRVNLNLEEYAVENLRLDCGASKSTIRLGSRLPETNVDVDAGASSIRIEVPESSGCEVRLDAPLSSKKFPGFSKIRDGLYRTDNYDGAPGSQA